jgi:hypothetical protein
VIYGVGFGSVTPNIPPGEIATDQSTVRTVRDSLWKDTVQVRVA